MQFKAVALILTVLAFGLVYGDTHTAASCSQAHAQAAVNAASDGDTVLLPAGSASWSSRWTISKGITLKGAGATRTFITNAFSGNYSALLVFNAPAFTRVTDIAFRGGDGRSYHMELYGSAGFRVDHCDFAVVSGGVAIQFGGNAPCLIDHNTFTTSGNAEILHNMGLGPSDASGWSCDVVPGSADAAYVEDNTFTNNATGNPAYFWGCSAIQSYYGSRTVFRRNLLVMAQVDQHGTGGMIGARWWEIYDNTFSTDVPNASQCCFITLRAGSGVVFGNHHVGDNLNGNAIDLYEEDAGYPTLYQIGRGKNQALDPAYVWGNDAFFSVSSQTPSMVQANRDYFLAPKPGYTPYTYPHPLTLDGGTAVESSLPKRLFAGPAAFTAYNVSGQAVATFDGQYTARETVSGFALKERGLPNGLYVLVIRQGTVKETLKRIVLR